MIVVDLEKCAACGRCHMVCPWHAIQCNGFPTIDHARCTDCRGKRPQNGGVTEPDVASAIKRRACIEYCPVVALRATA